jgi:hypothetical protein
MKKKKKEKRQLLQVKITKGPQRIRTPPTKRVELREKKN